MESSVPKVFISHASEDKTFVVDFASQLRENGVDVWVDVWEIRPGDSLVQKIFTEGMKDAKAVIMVLSRDSVSKKWVNEELDVAVVERIEGNLRLIPVIIDDCEIPVALKSIVWVRIGDRQHYGNELRQIISAIFDVSEKPPIGKPPAFVQTDHPGFSGLDNIDAQLFKMICDKVIETNLNFIETGQIQEEVAKLGISEEDMYESLEMLSKHSFIKGDQSLSSPGLDFFTITTDGFSQYAGAYRPEFAKTVDQVLIAIINQDLDSNKAIVENLHEPKVLVDFALDILIEKDFVLVDKVAGGLALIAGLTIEGRRAARSISD